MSISSKIFRLQYICRIDIIPTFAVSLKDPLNDPV